MGGEVVHRAGLAVATGHDRPDRIVMLAMDLPLQVTPQVGHPGLAQDAGHCHRMAIVPGQQQCPPLAVRAGQVAGKPGCLQCPHRLKQLIPEQRIPGDGKQLVLLGKGGDGDRVEQVALEHPLELDRLAGDTGQSTGGAVVRAAVVHGLGNVRKLIAAVERGEAQYDFVEVMACPGGCVGGGGQPIHDGEELAHTRGANLYFLDKNAKIRFSHENQDVMKLYNDFLEKPLSHKSHMLLHTDHTKWDMPR